MKAGIARKVSVAITPSAPRPTRIAGSRSRSCSAETSISVPSGRTSSTASICDERLRNREPVPCVAVDTAPAAVCLSMSPRFSSASP